MDNSLKWVFDAAETLADAHRQLQEKTEEGA